MNPITQMIFNDSLAVQTGDTLRLSFRFLISESLCQIGLGDHITILGVARVIKPCTTAVQQLNLNTTLLAMPNQFLNNPSCCRPIGISYHLDTLCNSIDSTGTFTVFIEHPEFDSLSLAYANDFELTLVGEDTVFTILVGQTVNIFANLPVGIYSIVATNNQMGIFVTETFELFNRSISGTLTASASSICAGDTILLTASNNNDYAEPITNYTWIGSDPPTPIINNQNTLIASPPHNYIYRVIFENDYGCTADTSIAVQVFQLPIVSIGEINDTICAVLPLNLELMPHGGTLFLNGEVQNELPLDLSTYNDGNYQLIYTFTDSLGCTASDTANFWLNTEPLCPCPVCPDPALTLLTIPDGIVASSQLGLNNFQNLCIRINHDFTFDQMATINNCHFIMAEGVRINNLSTLRIFNSTFEGCEFLWNGIINWGFIGAQGCEFRDAFTAIVPMRQTAHVATNITDCRFENNFIGIMNGAGTQYHGISINYSTFKGGILKTPAFEMNMVNNWSFAGVRLHNKMSLMSFESNIFDSLCVGLFSDLSFFDSKSNRFENIMDFDPQYTGSNYFFDSNQGSGTAIYATRSVGQIVGNWPDDEDAINFNNTTTAVYNLQGPLTIKNCRFIYDISNPIKTGIRIFNSANHQGYWISKNSIFANFTAIELNDFNNNNPVEIDNNNIFVSGLGSLARWGIRINNFPEQENLRITNNEISMMNYTMFGSSGNLNGIAISNGSKYIVFKNKINIIGRSGNGLALNGINFSRIQCNDITGSPVPSYPFGTNQLVSLRQSHSNDCRISQNYTNGANTGMIFAGTNNPTDLRCNTIGSHKDGLFISSGSIGDQLYKHNRWTGNYAGFGSRVGENNLFNNRFFVHAGADATYYPYYFPNYQSDCFIGDFFQCVEEITPNCLSCSEIPNPPSGSMQAEGDTTQWIEIARKLALDSLQFPEYNQEFRFYTLRDLEAAMQAGALQLPDTGIFIAFKASLQSSVAAALNQPEHWMKNALPDSSLRSELDIYHQQWLELMQQLKAVDSLIAEGNNDSLYYAARHALLSQIDLVEQQIQLIRQGALSTQGYTRDSSFVYLGGLVTQQEFEEYDRTISQIYLSTFAEGNFSLSSQDSAVIYSIASLCPALGGKAVYKARSLYVLLNNTIYFDDDSLCVSQSVMFRQSNPTTTVNQAIDFAKVYPNPTSNIVFIEFKEMPESRIIIKLRDNSGRLIEQKTLNNQINTLNLIESLTNSGLYLYELIDVTNGRRQTGKISFIK